MVKLERLLDTPYEYDYILPNGSRKSYKWRGAKVGSRSIQEVDDDVFEDMKYHSVTLKNKKLVLVLEDNEESKLKQEEIESTMTDEDIEKKVYSVEEIKTLLEGNYKKLESVLKKENADTIATFVRVAKDIKLDSASKLDILAKLSNVPIDVLFEK
jgi:hypothetical protein